MSIIIPKGYKPLLDPRLTERAIKFVKDTFERELSGELRLSRVTSTLFVKANSGINDDLNGVERPVRFNVGNILCTAPSKSPRSVKMSHLSQALPAPSARAFAARTTT